VADPACECPCHQGHACVMPRHVERGGLTHRESPEKVS
jgi:hypothetical protein